MYPVELAPRYAPGRVTRLCRRPSRFLSLRASGIWILPVVMLLGHAAGLRAESAVPERPTVLVVINGDTITSAHLDRLLIGTHRSMEKGKRRDFDYRKLLTKLVNDCLLAQEAAALGMHEEPGLISELEVAFDKRVASQWARDHYQPDLDLAEDEVREYFDTYFATVQFRLAAVRSEELARAIRQAVDSGGDLDSLAREHSVDKFSAAGGLHRLMSYRDLGPALRDVADSTAVGNIAGPFLYRGVYAVARVEQKVPADTNSYEATRPRIERWLKQQANAVQWDAFVAEQRRLHPMDVDPTLLAAIRGDSAALFTQEFSIGSDRTFIRIGEDVRMSDAEFRKQVAHGAMTAATTPFPELLERLLDETGEKLALIAAAYADGYHQRPSNVQAYDRTLDSALVELYVKETVVPRIKFRRAEFQEYYEEHAEDFRVPDQLQCDRMMADSESVALAVYERLQDGADFRYISRQFDVTVAPPEESAKWLAASTFPQAIQHDLEILRNGECLSPRLTDEGWLILRLKGRRRGEVLPLEQVETKIRAAIFQRKFNEELDSVISILKENSDIHFDEKAIEQYFGNDS